MGLQRIRPSHEILSGATADVYFARANRILEGEGLDPVVTMEVFCREDAVLCGMGEARNLIGHVLADEPGAIVEALDDGDSVTPKEVVLRIQARYRAFALYETAMLGMLAQSTGWATAARQCVEAAAPQPVISFGARHVRAGVAVPRTPAELGRVLPRGVGNHMTVITEQGLDDFKDPRMTDRGLTRAAAVQHLVSELGGVGPAALRLRRREDRVDLLT